MHRRMKLPMSNQFITSTKLISKMSVECAGILFFSVLPYPNFAGMYTRHISPSAICSSAVCHPTIT